MIESGRCSFIKVDSLVGSWSRSLFIRRLNVSLVLWLLETLRVIDIDGQLSKLAKEKSIVLPHLIDSCWVDS